MSNIAAETCADVNVRAIDGWNAQGWEWGTPLSHEGYLRVERGEWRMLLAPTKPVPPEWYPSDLFGLRVLGLDNGFGYAFDDAGERAVCGLPFNPLKNPDHMAATP